MDYLVKIQEPIMQDFIIVKTPQIRNKEGKQIEYKIKVYELRNDQAEQYGELMKQTFIKHHKEQVARELEKIKKEL